MIMIIINITLVLASFAFMEFIAWSTHKYIMHGPLWFLHKDHHIKNNNRFFELNDFFAVIFGLPGIVFLFWGISAGFDKVFFWIGLGISLYGLAYFTAHDVFIHQRIRLLRNSNKKYFRAMRRAHKIHHKHIQKENGECFGFLWVPKKYFDTV